MCLSGDVKTSSKLTKGRKWGESSKLKSLLEDEETYRKIHRKLLRKLERIKGSQSG